MLPPGQAGGFRHRRTRRDQIPLYDGLTPQATNVTAADLPNFFKKNVFGLGGLRVQRTQRLPGAAGPGRSTRDSFGVPHIEAPNRDDVMYGIGFVTAEDRRSLMDTLRGPGRVAALDAPGLNPFQLAQTFQPFNPSQQTEDFLASQVDLRACRTRRGQRIVDDIDNYLAGRQRLPHAAGNTARPWNRNDVVAVAALIGAVFGKGGGDEARRSQLLSALQDRLGEREGEQVWNDLREQNDPETSVSIDGIHAHPPGPNQDGQRHDRRGQPRHDRGATASLWRRRRSRRPATRSWSGPSAPRPGIPFFVAGPQVGYFYPQRPVRDRRRTAAASTRGARRSPAPGPTWSSGAGRTTRGARPPRATTTSTSSSRSSVATTRTTASRASAGR